MTETPVNRGAHLADPGPLGLAGFALTTFLLSCVNSGLVKDTEVAAVLGLAFAYGGLAQLLAGMWEFAKGNTFGATAFSSYGAFWLSFWWMAEHGEDKAAGHGVALYLFCWGIFTAYMFVASLGLGNPALMVVFALLTLTFLLLAFGGWNDAAPGSGLTAVGGWFGLATAVAAWYTSLAGVAAFTFKRPIFPTGAK
ncbi:MAG: acetate uptake transporter [Nocardioidaceae bacterium]|nr:acetate uptake transporter [Nocardioidaceae bacterium]MCL2612541.1 acetate uptake transporter [Nocardioidaceae bacterium]